MSDFTDVFSGALTDLMETFGDPIIYHPKNGPDVSKNIRGDDLLGEYRAGGHDVDDGESNIRVSMKSIGVNQEDLPDGMEFRLGDCITHSGIKYVLSDELDRTDQFYRFALQRC